MKTMINNKLFDGYEGEAELTFTANENKLIIWNGYFETILDNLLDCEVEKRGIITEYFAHEGWYDDSPWLIEDVNLTIGQLKYFDSSKINQNSLKKDLDELIDVIISFLQDNSLTDIYIEYN
ncbi:hypothetical protein ACWOFR_04710 [Carnobacterium gallinarum]|uniref:hypothetical protein n=1 Tax=Carnobacterium gallinarum TaxID=2749 RepID=UPI000A682D39|nr:hypothetical protein [Carnobacterium gallinarum]